MKTIRLSDRDCAIVLAGLRAGEQILRNKGHTLQDFCASLIARTGSGIITADEIEGLIERIDDDATEERRPAP